MTIRVGAPVIVPRPARDLLGEGPLWSARRRSLFWVDILGHAVNRLDLATGEVERHDVGEPIGWLVERSAGNGFVAGLASGFADLTFDPLRADVFGAPEPDRPSNRLNDAKVDRWGRIWAGSKDERDAPPDPAGALYRLDPDRRWSRMEDGIAITNGPTFSVDGSVLYHTDTLGRTVYAYDLAADGSLSRKRVFVRFGETDGYPDGMTTDAEGGVWIAHWGASRLSRFTADGRLDLTIAMPTAQITSCAFGGPELRTLFVTSAAIGRQGDEAAGQLFTVEVTMTGIQPSLFGG